MFRQLAFSILLRFARALPSGNSEPRVHPCRTGRTRLSRSRRQFSRKWVLFCAINSTLKHWSGFGVPITSPKFYTAAQTDDLRQALMYISKLYPNAPLLGLGFSIGGNVLVRYLAEDGVNSLLSSACILACVRSVRFFKIVLSHVPEALGSRNK